MDGPTVTALGALLAAGVALTNAYRQDRRAQFSQMVTILSQQDARFESSEFRAVRRRASRWLLDGSPEGDTAGEQAARDLLNFFETIAFLHRREAVDADAVWHYFASWFLPYHTALEPLCKREQLGDPNIFRECESLFSAVFQVERERRDYRRTESVVAKDHITEFLKSEAGHGDM